MSDYQPLSVDAFAAYVREQLETRQRHVDAIRQIDQMCAEVFDLLAQDVPVLPGVSDVARPPLTARLVAPSPVAQVSAPRAPTDGGAARNYGLSEASIVETMDTLRELIRGRVNTAKELLQRSPSGRHRVQVALRRLRASGEVVSTGRTNALRYWLAGAVPDAGTPSDDDDIDAAPVAPLQVKDVLPARRATRRPASAAVEAVSPLTHRTGETVIVDGVEMERVWSGQRSDPSLLGDRATREASF